MFNLFRSNKYGQSKSHLSNLIAVAFADGTLDDTEWLILQSIALSRGVEIAELEQIRDDADVIKFIPPTTHREKIEQIYELVKVMIADGNIDQEELNICRKLAEKLKIHPRIITDMLTRIPNLIKQNADSESIIDEICTLTK